MSLYNKQYIKNKIKLQGRIPFPQLLWQNPVSPAALALCLPAIYHLLNLSIFIEYTTKKVFGAIDEI